MSSRPKFIREVRNGKAVYVPSASSDPAMVPSGEVRPSQVRAPRFGLRLARLMWLGSFCAIAGALWLSLQYLLNPDVAFWLDRGLLGRLGSQQPTSDQPQTLDQLQAAIEKQGKMPGQTIVLSHALGLGTGLHTATNLAIPILAQDGTPDCKDPCREIREIRVYRALQLPFLIRMFQRNPYFRQTDAIAVQGPSGADLLALDQNPLLSEGSDQPLPLTQAEVYEPAPQPGLWLRLTGLKTQGSGVSTYGQVYYFDPFREQLNLMTNWVSPSGDTPQWQQVTGDELPELVVNETVGIEPHYEVYLLQMADGAAHQLQPIRLTDPAFANLSYTKGLALARSGLWVSAASLLREVKAANPKQWTAMAQAQLDYIQLHAQITQAQAEQPSASAVQRILGYLTNGSWQAALDVLQSDRTAGPELREMLLSDSGRLANRIDTALKANPTDPNVIAWGALLRFVRTSGPQAIAWAQQQSNGNGATLTRIKKLIQQLNQPDAETVPKSGAEKQMPGPQPTALPKPIVPSNIPLDNPAL
ncbi:MAG: hypothetical protein WCD18_19865 [Thermosynechococcaceae cyanobacterium]